VSVNGEGKVGEGAREDGPDPRLRATRFLVTVIARGEKRDV
jgi:hypothetical protein